MAKKSDYGSMLGVLMGFFCNLIKVIESLGEKPDDIFRLWVKPQGETAMIKFAEQVIAGVKGKQLPKSVSQQLEGWRVFYLKFFGIKLDLDEVKIPPRQEGFDRLIVVAKVTRNQVFAVCAKQFNSWCWQEDLDDKIKPDARDSKNDTYAIWVRDRVEADEENKGQSFSFRRQNDCVDENILERMLHELKYWDETGLHLDIDNWTMTSSLWCDGFVVFAWWDDCKFKVDYGSVGGASDYLRARSAVSLPLTPSGAQG